MAIDLFPFGLAETTNVNGSGDLAVLRPWLPSTPRPIDPGQYDSTTTSLQRLYWLWSQNPLWRDLAGFIGQVFAANVEQMGQLQSRRALEDVCGPALDDYGFGVGLPRSGLGCEDYRQAIRVRGASLVSSGTIEEILSIVEGLFGAEAAEGAYTPSYPAGFSLTVPSLTAEQAQLLAFLLIDPATGAGPVPSGVGVALYITDAELAGYSSSTAITSAWVGPRYDSTTGADASVASSHASVYVV
jgi:hypothetical protein